MPARPFRRAILPTLGLLAACVGPAGPVVGDWRGEQEGRNAFNNQVVELVLDGTPGARSGRYRMAVTYQDTLFGGPADMERWSGTWTREQRPGAGGTRTIIRLHDMLPNQIDTYELASDGTLHPLDAAGRLWTGPAGRNDILSPVRRGPGYGRV